MLSATQPLSEKLPAHGCRHVAIIMDGNGRWAKKQGKIRAFGHKAGAKSVRRAVSFAANNGIEALTLYAFSSENWNRPAQEVSALMELFVWALDSEVKSLHRHNVRLRIIGDTSRFNSRLQERIRKSEALTAGNTGLTLNIAANPTGGNRNNAAMTTGINTKADIRRYFSKSDPHQAVSSPGSVPPKRRSRLAKAFNAPSKSCSSKSGQRTSVK